MNPAWNLGGSFEGWDQGQGAFCEISDICQGLHYSVQTQLGTTIQTQPELSNEAVAAGKNGCIYGRSTTAYLAGLFSGFLYTQTVIAGTSLSFPTPASWGQPSGASLVGTPGPLGYGPHRRVRPWE